MVIELILEAGAEVTISGNSGAVWRPTGKAFDQLGVPDLPRMLGAELITFEEYRGNIKMVLDNLSTRQKPGNCPPSPLIL